MQSSHSVRFVFLATLIAACSRGPAPRLPEHRLGFGGDFFLGRGLNLALFDRPARDRVFAAMAPLFSRMDLLLLNGEGVVSGGGIPTEKGELQSQHYRAHPLAIDLLADAGIDIVTIGNNHSGDYGPDALREELDRFRLAGIDWTGGGLDPADARRPAYRRVGDTVVAVVGIDLTGTCRYSARSGRPGSLCFAGGDPARHDRIEATLKEILKEARRHAHVVLLSPHWGPNRTERPVAAVRALAGRLMELGFDAILGHSAHRIHGVELFDGRPVVYDAGNLAEDYDGPRGAPPHRGVFWEIVFSRAGVERLLAHPITLSRNRTRPAQGDVAADVLATLVDRSAEMGTTMTVDRGTGVIDCEPGEAERPDDPGHVPSRPRPARVREAPSAVLLDRLPATATPTRVTFPGGISLLGFELVLQELPTPYPLQMVHTYWKTDQHLVNRHMIRIDALPAASARPDTTVGHIPGDWILPATEWPVGKIIDDRILVAVRGEATGTERFAVGLTREGRALVPRESSLSRVGDSMVLLGQTPFRAGAPRLFDVLAARAPRSR